MNSPISTNLNIPDLWYDFYARFLPGCAFIAAFRWLYLHNGSSPSLSETIVLAALGYLLGLFFQPLGSILSMALENIALESRQRNRVWLRTIKQKLSNSKEPQILSKMHGEVSFFTQSSFLTVLLIFFLIHKLTPHYQIWLLYMLAIIQVIFASLVATRMVKRAEELEEVLGHGSIIMLS